jgi:8-oxo-dGTP diphosphatase
MLPASVETALVVLLIVIFGFNLSQRTHLAHGEKKRFATLGIALVILGLYAAVLAIRRHRLPAWTMLAALAGAAAVFYALRSRLLVFRRRCLECGTDLPVKTVLYRDDNLCESCRGAGAWPYESESRMDPERVPATVEEVDWEAWEPSETAVLCYVISDGQVLLINKKTGLGKGLVNAPGGRIEEGESPAEAAVRELQEEVGITPIEPYEVGRLSFLFTNGFSLSGRVFFAERYRGEPRESDEADPFWVPIDKIPYEKMWEDDRVWLPKALAGSYIEGRFIFEEEKMLSMKIDESPRPDRPD